MRAILISSGLAVVFSLLGTRLAIRWFTEHGFGQPIRDDGPTTHHVKQGVPTMGGLVISASATAAYPAATLLTGGRPSASARLLLLLFLGCGIVGFLDDFIKVYAQHNQGDSPAAPRWPGRRSSPRPSASRPRSSSPTNEGSGPRRSTSPSPTTGGSSCPRWWSCS
ncbi:hypothetical protein LP418_25930 [Nocardioides sp. B-3]|nr:hypothetical protein [Nocardioides sp. B-3]UUZ59266.1 hypothetical protein LP418_25930 [Nocardioides sp. B-3]